MPITMASHELDFDTWAREMQPTPSEIRDYLNLHIELLPNIGAGAANRVTLTKKSFIYDLLLPSHTNDVLGIDARKQGERLQIRSIKQNGLIARHNSSNAVPEALLVKRADALILFNGEAVSSVQSFEEKSGAISRGPSQVVWLRFQRVFQHAR